MTEKIQKQLQLHHWEATIIVAVSGGVDSVVLLHTLRQQLPDAKLVVAHVNYHLREESDADEKFVRHLADKYHAVFEQTAWLNVPDTAVEKQARDFRYQFFEQLASKYHTATVVVAHHADDQAETVLLKLIRGGQLMQLAGMRQQNRRIVRPFLLITKQELVSYAQNHNLNWHEDKTNHDAMYTPRNFLRQIIIPKLKKINPRVVPHINAFAQQIKKQDDLITAQVEIYVQTIENSWQIIPNIWLEPTIKHYIQKKGIYQFKQVQILQVIQLLNNDKKPTGMVQLSKNVNFVKSYQYIHLENSTKMTNTLQVLPPIMLKLNQWQNFAENTFLWTNSEPNSDEQSFSFNLAQLPTQLYLRPVKTSDKLALVHGHKKLRRLAIDEKLSTLERQDMQVLATQNDEVIAVKMRKHWRVNADFVSKQDVKPYWLAWRIEEK
ncbi:tRNA lysidine(34) synthetase TilS [Leuconostoc gelidum]|uniref:tRNA lysidine(34) synthetase TilS n=1 Tax=Leuconostoc gelidum TaxID=1244 RepID=UPI001C7CB92A|nr:tRNA lysidine(34) synthetase TilS [Leuconostoc gelidum]MBZ6010352.1 tRNA lysidine(34) synthetase TilS [Leuconostoc gelidum subsp. aenigmaticum]